MDTSMKIIKEITRIKEHADIFHDHNINIMGGISVAEAHCIDKIGSIECANVTKIASAMFMSKGAISKITKQLLCKELIESYQTPENKKEVYFLLTEMGKQVYRAHKKCHKSARQNKLAILSKYKNEEKAIILKFLKDLTQEYDDEIKKEN